MFKFKHQVDYSQKQNIRSTVVYLTDMFLCYWRSASKLNWFKHTEKCYHYDSYANGFIAKPRDNALDKTDHLQIKNIIFWVYVKISTLQ